MKAFIAIIVLAAVAYGVYYTIGHKEQISSANIKKVSWNGVDYIAPNIIDNPGYVYAQKNGEKVWEVTLYNAYSDTDFQIESRLSEYKIRNMRIEQRGLVYALLATVGEAGGSRTYVLDVDTGKLLDIDIVNPPSAR